VITLFICSAFPLDLQNRVILSIDLHVNLFQSELSKLEEDFESGIEVSSDGDNQNTQDQALHIQVRMLFGIIKLLARLMYR